MPFVQVGSSLSRKYGGSGLGLSIAGELCRLHGGALTIHSIEGQGTKVRIVLPLRGAVVRVLKAWSPPKIAGAIPCQAKKRVRTLAA